MRDTRGLMENIRGTAQALVISLIAVLALMALWSLARATYI